MKPTTNEPPTGTACLTQPVRRDSIFNAAYDWWLESPDVCQDLVFLAVQKCSKNPTAKPHVPWWQNDPSSETADQKL